MSLISRISKRVAYKSEQWTNRFLDSFLGVDTGFIREPQAGLENSDAIPHAKRYHASNYLAAIRALRFIRKHYGQQTLVDLGCGAGRVLVLAAWFGFTDIVGVDIDPDLVSMARVNFEKYCRRFRSKSRLNLSVVSAARFSLPDKSCTIFLFNPFDDCIFEQFLENNREFVQQGDLKFVCINPRLGEVLRRFGFDVRHEWSHADFSRIARIYCRQR